MGFFRFLQGLTDLQDRISPLLVNKKTPEGVYVGCVSVCKDFFEQSWTVVEYMGWYDM